MNKILVTIYVVALDQSYDVLLPINLQMNDIYDLIQNTLIDLTNGNYQKHDNMVLLASNGMVINNNNVARLSGLTNGCKVVLI